MMRAMGAPVIASNWGFVLIGFRRRCSLGGPGGLRVIAFAFLSILPVHAEL